jgi:Sortase domain
VKEENMSAPHKVQGLLWGASALLLAVAIIAITLSTGSSDSGPATARLVGRAAESPSRPGLIGMVRSRPTHLSIPAIDLSVPLSVLGLNADGTVSVPTDFNEPGWYRYGASPGQLGTAVVLGHIDSYLGPAVFFHLRDLVPGDKVMVQLADGKVARFVVIGTATYLKARFPATLVYGRRSYSALQLITCGGAFDYATRSYLSNVVIYCALVTQLSRTPSRQHPARSLTCHLHVCGAS